MDQKEIDSSSINDSPCKIGVWRQAMRDWLLEIASLLVSMACVPALAALLVHYNEEALPEWSLGLTLNTVVALLSTLCRSAFMYLVVEGIAQAKCLWFKLPR